uniref:CCHC-type domain-containing protein n=1 Tax=Anopheles funestus TaxID=62324 RepID=A0A182RLR3_ANOFN
MSLRSTAKEQCIVEISALEKAKMLREQECEEREALKEAADQHLQCFREYVSSVKGCESAKAKPKLLATILELLEMLFKENKSLLKRLETKTSKGSGNAESTVARTTEAPEFLQQTKKGRKPKAQKSAMETKAVKEKGDKVMPAKQAKKGKTVEPPKPAGHKAGPLRAAMPSKKQKPEAVLVKAGESSSYAEILKGLRNGENLKEVGEQVSKVRRAQNGDLLLELKRGKSPREIVPALEKHIGEKATLRALAPTVLLEVRDVDEVTTVEDVATAIEGQSGIAVPVDGIRLRKGRVPGTQVASLKVLLKKEKFKVGWSVCPIKATQRLTRCFKCWCVGHLSNRCPKEDRRDLFTPGNIVAVMIASGSAWGTVAREIKTIMVLLQQRAIRNERRNQ